MRTWDVAGGKMLATLRGGGEGLTSVAFAPDGKRLASAGRGEARIRPIEP